MQHWSHVLGVTVAVLLAGGSGQTGTVYRFRSGDGSGTVWVIGDNARLEPDPKDGVAASDRVSIWKAGGKQHLLLNTKDHTYYDQVTYLKGHTYASVHTLNVREPFIVADVGNIRVDLLSSSPQQISASGWPMYPFLVTWKDRPNTAWRTPCPSRRFLFVTASSSCLESRRSMVSSPSGLRL
jgi:hypothetical protein